MRVTNLLTAVMVAGLFAAPAFADSTMGGNANIRLAAETSGGSTQIHCSPAKNGNAAADPNCAQRVPPMPGNSGAGNSGSH
jgi:hypothetical protein